MHFSIDDRHFRGLMTESDGLLSRELSRSQSPYYYMLGLAANAKARGNKPAALD